VLLILSLHAYFKYINNDKAHPMGDKKIIHTIPLDNTVSSSALSYELTSTRPQLFPPSNSPSPPTAFYGADATPSRLHQI